MLLPTRHEVLAPGMHRFVFASQTRPGVEHALVVDFHDDGPSQMMCLCEAGLYGRFCKHQRLLVLGLAEAARLDEEEETQRQARRERRRRTSGTSSSSGSSRSAGGGSGRSRHAATR